MPSEPAEATPQTLLFRSVYTLVGGEDALAPCSDFNHDEDSVIDRENVNLVTSNAQIAAKDAESLFAQHAGGCAFSAGSPPEAAQGVPKAGEESHRPAA